MEGCETTNFVYGASIQHTKIHFSYLVNQHLVCDITSTISYSMFFKAILKFLDFLETNLKF